MGKEFVIACPQCGNYAQGKNGIIFKTRKINCSCGHLIDVKAEKLASRQCPQCKNDVIYDQTKGREALCPVCHAPLATEDAMSEFIGIPCPSCGCELHVNKSAASVSCAICGNEVDVQRQIAAKRAKESGMPSVIECRMDNSVFVKRHPIDNFVTGSKLIVHESQEAVFFKDGAALDSFGPGGHILETDKLPLMSELAPLPFGNGDPFRTEIYFVNKTEQKEIKWGTPNKITVREPKYNMYVDIGAFGTFNMIVKDARRFIIKNIGTIDEFRQSDVMGSAEYSTDSAVVQFKDLILNRIVDVLAKTLGEQQFDIFLLDRQKSEFAAAIRDTINEHLDDYGLFLPQFYINKIALPEDNPNFTRMRKELEAQSLNTLDAMTAETERASQLTRAATEMDVDFIKAQNEARKKLLMEKTSAEGERARGMAKADIMKAQGYTYHDESSRMVGMEAMKNGIAGGDSGSGSPVGDAVGIGVALGAMGGILNMTKDVMNPLLNTASDIGAGIGGTANGGVQEAPSSWNCSCGAANLSSKCCPECGAQRPLPVQGWNCSCGRENITSGFCPDCGAKKPVPAEPWNCSACGRAGITSKFCPDCGAPKPLAPLPWDCPDCGCTGITSKFCPDCGAKKPDNSANTSTATP